MIIMGDSHLIECFKYVLKVNKECLKNQKASLHIIRCREHFFYTLWNSFIFTIYIVNYQEEMVWEGNVSAL